MKNIVKILFKIQLSLGHFFIDLSLSLFKVLHHFLVWFRQGFQKSFSFLREQTLSLYSRRKDFTERIISSKIPSRWLQSSIISSFFKFLVDYFVRIVLRIKTLLLNLFRLLFYIITFPFKMLRRVFVTEVIFFFLGIFFTLFCIMIPHEVYILASSLPTTELLVERGSSQSTKILDRNGNLLYEIYEDRKYEPVSLEQIPQHVIDATLAIEDDRFYEHDGFRLDSILRALRAIVFESDLQGGSTITQQLVKNVLLTPERTVSRKTKEIILSVLAEHRYSKDRILELYLNNISYGGTAWGIEAASQKFFGKHVWELDLAEASMLAGLPSAPSAYSPLNKDTSLAKGRQKVVLDRMVKLGYVSQQKALEAYQKDLTYNSQKDFIRAPHFVSYVRSLLEEKYGSRFVTFGGLTVKTSLDVDLQQEVQRIVEEGIEENAYLNLTNGAALVLDVETGEIRAYVGSVDFFQEDWGAFDVVTAERQPGSSIKPVTYSLALSQDFTPATIINDSPTAFSLPGQPAYRPVNYDGRYHGKVTVRQALANSYNIPAVKVVEKVTPRAMVQLGKKMGLSSWDEDSTYGLSVTLGGKEVKLIEHTNVYATLARGGTYQSIQPFLSIRDSKGKELLRDWLPQQDEILDSGVAFLITDILSDNNARAPAFGYRSPLYIPNYQVAVKTGTTDDKKDNWTMGYSPSYVVGVWVGNNDNTPMNRYLASGLTGAAPIWNSIMQEVLKTENQIKFQMPDSVFIKRDEKCGKSEYFIKGSKVPDSLCLEKEDSNEDKKDD